MNTIGKIFVTLAWLSWTIGTTLMLIEEGINWPGVTISFSCMCFWFAILSRPTRR